MVYLNNCIQSVMRCSCVVKTPKGVKYHPALKAIYWRVGADGKFIKIGLICPNCKKVILE